MALAAPLAVPLLIGSAALTAGSQIMAANERSSAAAFEQQQQLGRQEALRIQGENLKIAADQAETRRREELVSNMETIEALRAGRGVGGGSPTGLAIFDALTSNASRDITTERFDILSKADQSRIESANAGLAAEMAGRKAKTSLIAGYLGAAGTVASAGYSASRSGAFGSNSVGSRSTSDPTRLGALY